MSVLQVWRGGSWEDVQEALRELPEGSQVLVPAGELPHPRTAGARRSVGLPRGQLSDWRFSPAVDCSGVHVHETRTGWLAHRDSVHPACGVVAHLRADAPEVLAGITIGVGAVAGLLLTWSPIGVLAGGFAGGVAARRRPTNHEAPATRDPDGCARPPARRH